MSERLPIAIANQKENLTWEQVSSWLNDLVKDTPQFTGTVIFCPSNPFLVSAAEFLKEHSVDLQQKDINIQLGAQDMSKFTKGAEGKSHTGEVTASQLSGIADYVIIGHSERRRDFGEDDETLSKKVENARNAKIEPIFCVQDENTFIPEGVRIVAYEPPSAIGTGNPDTPENARSVATKLKERGDYIVLYGGSVNGNNVPTFLKENLIDGVLVGGASLEYQSFINILKASS